MKRFFALLLTVVVIFAVLPAIPVFAGAKPNYLTDPDSIFANDNNPKVAHVYMQNNPGFEDWSFDCSEKELDFVGAYCQMEYDNKNASWVQLRAIDITLYADCTTEYFPRCRDCDLNINLNGHTWTTSENRPSFEVTNHKSITISNGTLTFTGVPDYPIYSYGGKVTVSNVVFKDCVCSSYGLICVESKGSIESKPTVADPSKGEIYQKYDEKASKTNGALHLKNVRFENCKSSSYGACVYVNSDQTDAMTIDNCQFINCSSKYGGALYLDSDYNTYNFTNCEFVNCSASVDGGAIYCDSEDSKLNFTNCNAYRCHADDCGGFIFCNGERTVYNGAGNLAISTIDQRSNIVGCYALDSGGAFYSSVNDSCSNYSELRNFNMAYNTAGADKHDFNVVKSNDSNSWGGAVCLRGTDMKLAYCDLYSNYAPYYGGAVYCGYRRTSVENCTFYENRCNDEYGNDIYLDSATQYVTGCTFYSNGNSVAGYDAAKWENNITTPTSRQDIFSTSEIEDGDYIIYTALDDKYALTIDGGWGAYEVSGDNVCLYENGDANIFTITKDKAKGTYIIKSKITNMVLDVSGGSKENGANIQQWESNGTDAQRWVFEQADNGYFYIRCVGGQYMDADGMVNGNMPHNNVNIHSWSFTGADNQKFKLVRVSGDTKTAIDSKTVPKTGFGNGSEKDPYKISNADQWRTFTINVLLGETYSGKYFELTDDISISYIPVGNYNQGKAFKGTLDGKNHTVHYLDFSEDWDRGLFSYCNDATVKNLRVTGKITGTESLAGISAGAIDTTFENCVNDADIISTNAPYVAGISAKTYNCEFINCVNNGTINCGKNVAGGIAAWAEGDDSKLVGCRNNGYVSTSNDNAGGMVGEATGHVTVKQCENNALIESGNVTAGGMVGCLRKGADIINCINTENGVISSKQFAAGIIGWTGPSKEKVNIKNCVNSGEIKVTVGECGGIAVNLDNDSMNVVNCFNATTKIPYIPYITAITNEIEEGDYIIVSALDESYAVDIENGNNAKNIPGKNAHLWKDGDANVFTITKDKNKGAYIIKSKVTGLVLDVSCASRDDGANIQQWESNGTDAQRWVFEPANNGYCYIRCLGGQYMDASGMINGVKPTNGVNIQSWSYTGDTNQQFRLVRLNDIAEGDYVIYTALNEKLSLDIDGGKGSVNVSGRNVHLWENGDANVFTITKDKDKNAYVIKSKVTGLVLDVFGGSKDDGTGIQQWESNGTNAQRWKFESTDNGYYYIHWLDGKYMDIWKGNASSGSLIVSNQFTGADSQKFKFVKVNADEIENGDYIIQSAVDERFAVDIAGGTFAVNAGGANTHLWQNGDASVFTITKDKDKDAYIIKSKITGLSLDVANGSKENGANVQQWASNGTDAQRWVFENTGNGCYYIRCLGGQYMDVSGMTNGNKPYNGVNIHSWSFTGATNQQFKLVKVSSTTGALLSADSKGAYTNCYYLSGSVDDERAKALSLADCGETLKAKMNMYIAKNVNSGETADWALWQINSETGISMPDLKNVYAKNIKGDGTASKPFLISSSKGFKELANNIGLGIDYNDKYFRLTENIAYTGTPIGSQENPFTGIFDGNGHSVTLHMGGQNYTALFGVLVNGTVKNLKVSGFVQGAGCTAAIVGSAYNAHIDNCYVTASVEGTDANVGGVVGLLNQSTVSNCRMEGTVKNSGRTSTGGIVGGAITGGKLINCVCTGKVTGDKAVGGLIGCVMYGDPMIVNCASVGSTAENSKDGGYEHGGLVGFINSEINAMTISNCFSSCGIGIKKDSGIIVGNNQKAKKVTADHISYKKVTASKTSNTLGTGNNLKDATEKAAITKLTILYDSSAENLTANIIDEDKKVIEVDGIKLTSWVKESSNALTPQSYVEASSFVASVFSAQNLPMLIVIGTGLVAGIVGVAVMYRKKKKKNKKEA